VSGLIRQVGVTNGADLFVGDAISLGSGLAVRGASNAELIGVIVGFGKKNSMTQKIGGAFGDPATPSVNFYDDSANTHTDWVAYYVPTEDVVFEAQTATALTVLPGATMDITTTAGSQTTGISGMELTTSSNADVQVVEIPDYEDNDHTLVNGRYWVMFTDTETR
jgi:hypothetical protein